MNELRKVKIKYVTGNIRPISGRNQSVSSKKVTKKIVKKVAKKSDREIFKDEFSKYVKYNISKVDKKRDKYDNIKVNTYKVTLKDIDKNFYTLSKKVKKVYKYNGVKIKKIDSDTVVLNLTRNYINEITSKRPKNNDSLFDIYATYNYTIDGINYDYLNDFHINIKETVNSIREGFAIKTDLRRPKYLSKKIGKGRKEIFKLAFKLVTLSEEITCDVPRKSYLEVCCTKEDFIEIYELLGGGIRRYMKFYDIAPMFKLFVRSMNRADILNKLGYKNYRLNKDAYLGICALLYAQIILGTYGTRKGIRAMLEVQSESCNRLISLMKSAS